MPNINILGTHIGTHATHREREWDIWELHDVTLNEQGRELLKGFPEKLTALIFVPDEGYVEGHITHSGVRPDFTAKLTAKWVGE